MSDSELARRAKEESVFKNYLKVAFRNLLRQKGYSFINVAGLAIGIACCILILLYVQDELSYDRQPAHADRTYRITLEGSVGGNDFNMAISCAPIGPTLTTEMPEVEQYARIRNFGFPVLRYKDKVFSEERFYAADSTFLEVFAVALIQGDPKTALTKPNNLVLTRSMAEKYFGDEDPLGKSINADNRRDWLVTGVIEDAPVNSHIHYDFLGSLTTYEDSRQPFWISNNYYTYIVVRDGVTLAELSDKLPAIVRKYAEPQILQATGITFDQLIESGGKYSYHLQPLTDIHLRSDLDYEAEPNGNAATVTIFGVIALAILLIACINFMNLATARSSNRGKEVGIRKTLGSNRTQLVRQFLAEAVFTTCLAVVAAMLLVYLLLPHFNQLSGKELTLDSFMSPIVVLRLLGLAAVVGLIAGSYPAFFLAAFQPVKVLKGVRTQSGEGRSANLRTGLVVFQFTISIVLIIGTIVVNNQLDFIQNRKLGFNKEQVVIVHKTDDIGKQVYPFMEELRKNANIIDASNSTTLPGLPFSGNVHQRAGASGEDSHLIFEMRSDYDFAETYQIKMAAGRYFSRAWSTDSSAIVLNQAAVQTFGLTDDPIGQEISAMGRTTEESEHFKVVGVMEDFHFESLHQKIRPMAIKLHHRGGLGRYVSVRVAPGHIQETVAAIEETWGKFAGSQAFEHTFFDRDFARLYDAETQTRKILTLFSMLAVVVACLGLFGLASFTTEQRTKEIGIRKALGASVAAVIALLSRQFIKWVLVASAIAWLIAGFAMRSWLQNFAYHTNLEPWSFVIAAIGALVIALLTVSYQTIRAALMNPVDSLRYE